MVAWAKIDTLAQLKADNTKDDRFQRKIKALPTGPRGPAPGSPGVPTPWQFNIYSSNVTSVPLIRNEELILMRAEAKIQTGDLAGGTADLNVVRTVSGGLAPIATVASAAAGIQALFYERYWSLLLEGWHWVDARRYGFLSQLPLDQPTHKVFKVIPIPNAECLARNKTAGNVPAGACP